MAAMNIQAGLKGLGGKGPVNTKGPTPLKSGATAKRSTVANIGKRVIKMLGSPRKMAKPVNAGRGAGLPKKITYGGE